MDAPHCHVGVAIDRPLPVELLDLGAGAGVVAVPAVWLALGVGRQMVAPHGVVNFLFATGAPRRLQVHVELGSGSRAWPPRRAPPRFAPSFVEEPGRERLGLGERGRAIELAGAACSGPAVPAVDELVPIAIDELQDVVLVAVGGRAAYVSSSTSMIPASLPSSATRVFGLSVNPVDSRVQGVPM